jgi:hypothetical protein
MLPSIAEALFADAGAFDLWNILAGYYPEHA